MNLFLMQGCKKSFFLERTYVLLRHSLGQTKQIVSWTSPKIGRFTHGRSLFILKPWPINHNIIVGCNMLHTLGHGPCCDILRHVGCCWLQLDHFQTWANNTQLGGQRHAICCTQHCCDMIYWHVVTIWPGLFHKMVCDKKKQSQLCIRDT